MIFPSKPRHPNSKISCPFDAPGPPPIVLSKISHVHILKKKQISTFSTLAMSRNVQSSKNVGHRQLRRCVGAYAQVCIAMII